MRGLEVGDEIKPLSSRKGKFIATLQLLGNPIPVVEVVYSRAILKS